MSPCGWQRFMGVKDDRTPVKCSVVQHNVEWDRLAEFGHDVKWIRPIERWILDRVDDVIAVSTDDKQRMATAGTESSKISVIPHESMSAGLNGEWVTRFAHHLVWTKVRRWSSFMARCITGQYRGCSIHCGRVVGRWSSVLELRVVISGQKSTALLPAPTDCFYGLSRTNRGLHRGRCVYLSHFSGGGTRMKLLEYMASSKAIVSTTKGC